MSPLQIWDEMWKQQLQQQFLKLDERGMVAFLRLAMNAWQCEHSNEETTEKQTKIWEALRG